MHRQALLSTSKKIFLFIIGVLLNVYLFFGALFLIQSMNYNMSWPQFLIVHFIFATLGGFLTDDPILGSTVGTIATVIISYQAEGVQASFFMSGIIGGATGGLTGKHHAPRRPRRLTLTSGIAVYGIPSLLIIYGLSHVQDPFRYPFGIGVMSIGIFVITIAKALDYI
jgi:hypothetical protein